MASKQKRDSKLYNLLGQIECTLSTKSKTGIVFPNPWQLTISLDDKVKSPTLRNTINLNLQRPQPEAEDARF